MKKHLLLFSLILVSVHLSEAQVGSDTKTVRINPNMPPNPPKKAGYKLVVWDEFDAPEVDTSRWCLWGDAWVDKCDPRCFSINGPDNVSSGNGVGRLTISAPASDSCDVKTSEITSFRHPPNGFRIWHVEPGSYLELRVKVPHGANTGCAGWLWGIKDVPREIDIWETYHDDDTEYQLNRHVGNGGAGEPFKVKVRDLQGEKVHMSQHFLTFGVHWEPNNIGFYLNGQFVAEYCCFDPEIQFDRPMTLRLSAGVASLNSSICPVESELPKAMEVDYVRYYVRDTVNSLYLVKMADSIQVDGQGNSVVCCPSVWVNYIPDVQYEVFSPAADFEVWSNVPDIFVAGIRPLPGLPLDTAYPLSVVAHFREPHSRSDTMTTSFFLTADPDFAPLAPNRSFPQPVAQARVYPTLTHGGETIQVENPFFYTLLQIVAVDGPIVHEEILTNGNASVTLPAGFSPGIYFVKLHSDCVLQTCKILVR